MLQNSRVRPLVTLMFSIALSALAPAAFAQDRDEHRDDRGEHRDERRDNGHERMREERRDDRGHDVDRYRHDHPRASARCHDGFFTSTHDRNRACRRHGGIDIWLML